MPSLLVRSATIALVASLLVVACGGEPASEVASTAEPAGQADPEPAFAESKAPQGAATDSGAERGSPADAAPTPPSSAPSMAAVVDPDPTPATSTPELVLPTGIVPVRMEIPAIGVDAPTIDLSLAGAEPEVPTNFEDTGWYVQTRLPGEIGPAVIAGHIDSRTGPAVFAELDQLVPGDEIIVYDAIGGSRTFVVASADQYPKGELPTSVFGFGEPEPELRLITCGGTFDPTSGHYRDNYVVFARLAA